MEKIKSYEQFPVRITLLATLVTIATYAIGAYIVAGFGTVPVILYLLYCLWIELRVLKRSCVNCYYYGKVCGLGRGVLCSLLFKRGDPQRFIEDEVTWVHLVPDFMVSIIPIVGGVILLIRDFAWPLVAMLAIIVILSTVGNAVIRGSFACKYCRQREIGCPAERLFQKKGGTH